MGRRIPCGTFELREKIGEGGMGEVWRGRDRRTDREVAVKIIGSELVRHEEYVEWFHREVRAQARLRHPHIVQLLGLGSVSAQTVEASEGRFIEGSPFFAMEYLEGGTLRSNFVVARWSAAERVLKQMLSALGFAHARDVVHRDLKPANILLEADGESQIKLSDFGLAFEVLSGTGERPLEAGPGVGTPDYMSPEQLRGEWRRYGPWTDLYSVGCIAFELVTGRRPYPGETAQKIATGHLVESVPSIEPLFAVPERLEEWIETLLRKEPEHRFWAAADALHELEEIADGFESTQQTGSAAGERPFSSSPVEVPETIPASGLAASPDAALGTAQTVPAVSATVPPPASGIRRRPGSTRTDAGSESPYDEEPGPQVWSDPRSGQPPPFPETWRRGHDVGEAPPGAPLGLFGVRDAPFAGRERERDTMWEALGEAVVGESVRTVFVTGEPGSGRSRLVEWIARRGVECGACTLLRATHGPSGGRAEGVTGLLQEIFNTWEMTRGEVREHLERTLRAWRGEEASEEDLMLDTRALTELLRPASDRAGSRGSSYRFSNLTERMAVVERVLRQLGRRRPVFLWFDDIHWSESSLAFVRYLLEESPSENLMIAATARLEAEEAGRSGPASLRRLIDRHEVRHLELSPLEAPDLRALVGGLLPLEERLVSSVVERTEGSPLFAVELLRDWVEYDALESVEGSLRLRDGLDAPFPEDLDALWRRRVTRLVAEVPEGRADETRSSLQVAAVLGTHVDESEWRVACRRAGVEPTRAVVEEMFDRGLAVPRAAGWEFGHAMFVSSLLSAARETGRYERFCAACAEAIEHCYPARTRQTAERRAEYLRRAGALEVASEVYAVAIGAALDVESYAKARRLFDERDGVLEELGAGEEDRARVRHKSLWLSYHLDRGDNERAEQLVEEVHDVASREDWASTRADALLRRASLLHRKGRHSEALEVLDRCAEIFRALGDRRGAARVELRRAMIHTWSGAYESAISSAEAAQAAFEDLSADVAACNAQHWKIYALIYRGEYERAERGAEELLEWARELGHRGTERECMNLLGELARYREDWGEARAYYRKYRHLNEQLGLFDALVAELNLSMVDLGEGAFERAGARLESLLERVLERDARYLEPTVRIGLLAAAAGTGDRKEWDEQLERARGALRSFESRDPDQGWLAARAREIAAERGWERASREAVDLVDEIRAAVR